MTDKKRVGIPLNPPFTTQLKSAFLGMIEMKQIEKQFLFEKADSHITI